MTRRLHPQIQKSAGGRPKDGAPRSRARELKGRDKFLADQLRAAGIIEKNGIGNFRLDTSNNGVHVGSIPLVVWDPVTLPRHEKNDGRLHLALSRVIHARKGAARQRGRQS